MKKSIIHKYIAVFLISFQQEFTYRVNFVMWRIRNILQIFIVFYLWDSVFTRPGMILFGYDRSKILTYVMGLILVRAFVLSAKAQEVAGEIARGELSNYLLKPIGYFKYWLIRDVASKALNMAFAFVEVVVLVLLLKPPFFIQTNPAILLGFGVSLVLAMFIFFILLFITSSMPFWVPEAAWGAHFLVTVVIVEFLSGALFPLDILPDTIQRFLNLTPFPYLIFFPLQVYLGKVTGVEILRGICIAFLWSGALLLAMNKIWLKGLKHYESHGK